MRRHSHRYTEVLVSASTMRDQPCGKSTPSRARPPVGELTPFSFAPSYRFTQNLSPLQSSHALIPVPSFLPTPFGQYMNTALSHPLPAGNGGAAGGASSTAHSSVQHSPVSARSAGGHKRNRSFVGFEGSPESEQDYEDCDETEAKRKSLVKRWLSNTGPPVLIPRSLT